MNKKSESAKKRWAKMSEKERKEYSKKANESKMSKTTPEQRKEWARLGGKKRVEGLTKEEISERMKRVRRGLP